MHFTLYLRGYCHLCDDMLHALQALDGAYAFTIDVVDVDNDMALVALYDELVPVLTASKNGAPSMQLCHYFLDVLKVRAFLES